jgi:RND family efflux transporter MFP subunit
MRVLQRRPIFALVFIALAVLTSCTNKAGPSAAPQMIHGVHLVQVARRKVPEIVDAVGTVRAAESATLSSQVMGTISNIAVREGDRVHAGQTLLTIDAAQMTAQVERADASVSAMQQQVAAAESEAALAASTLRRYEMLRAQKSVSPHEFEQIESQSKAAAARFAAVRAQQAEAVAAVSAARTMQGYTHIHAPFDGVVTERKVDGGSMASPGTPLLSIEKSGPLRLEISVDESLVSAVRPGSVIPVTVDALDSAKMQGRVARIVPAADPGSRSFLVKLDLPSHAGLYSGMFGHASFTRGTSRDVLTIPRSAVAIHGSMQSVYVVGPDHIAQVRYISAGNTDEDEVEVLAGLSAGELLVDSPADRELSGKRIEAEK